MFDKALNTPLNLNTHTVINTLEIYQKTLQYTTILAFKFEELSNFKMQLVALFEFLESSDFLLPFLPSYHT